jgi:tetratricopeptide (TPR) repeat protein
MPYDVFISYWSGDLLLAEELNRQLLGRGFSVWFDKARIEPGFDWHREIENGRDASRVVLPLLTPGWKTSEWCRFETYGAEGIVPLLFAGEWPEVATPPLRHFHYFDVRSRNPADWGAFSAAIRNLLVRPIPQKQPRVASLPYAHNPHFLGRDELLLEIHELLHPAPTTALTQGSVQAITGVGGVGKTTIAREYAEKFWRVYQDILWVRADPNLLPTEFARLALDLRALREPSQNADEDSRAALRELNAATPRLLILDNAPDEHSVQHWLPTAGGCRTIVTSRFTPWSAVVNVISVDILAREAARDLLLRRSGLAGDAHSRGADRLADQLGRLPLALEQAAAFMGKAGIDFDEYLALYTRRRLELLSERSFGGTHYPESVATTWRTTVAQLGQEARSLLQLISHFAADDIPVWVLGQAETTPPGVLSRIWSIGRRPVSKPDDGDRPLALRRALGELGEYSMVRLREDAVSVHRLVQAVQMDEQDTRTRKAWAKRAVLALNRSIPEADYPNFRRWARLLPHARVAATAVSEWDFRFGAAALLINHTAIYLQKRGQYVAAEKYFRQALGIWASSFLGKYHPNYSIGLSNLGILLNEQGKFADAEPILLEALSLRSKLARQPDHMTGTILSSLAILQKSRADHAGAEVRFREALEIRRRTVGEQDRLYAEALSNVATLFIDSERYEEAEPLFRKALEIVRQVVGKGHPMLSQVSQNLGVVYHKLKRYPEAERLYRAALESREDALGPDHPELAYIQTNLAKMYLDLGELAQAEPLLRRALEIRDVPSGEPHPEIARTLSYLGTVLAAIGRRDEADSLHRRALEIVLRAFGERSSLTATVLGNFAASLRAAGRVPEAEQLEARAKAIADSRPPSASGLSANEGSPPPGGG